MNRKTSVKTTVLEPVRLKSKAITKPRNINPDVRGPNKVSSSGVTISKAKRLADALKGMKWAKVRLDARKTYTTNAKLNLNPAVLFNSVQNYILLHSSDGLFADAEVVYKAQKAGDNFLIRYFIDVVSNNTEFKLFTFGAAPTQTLMLNAGPHEIPVVAVAQSAGEHSAQLALQMNDRAFYLQAIEIQPLDV